MLLINPPVVRPCEPPAGIAKLLGTLGKHNVRCRVLDANLEGLMSLLRYPVEADDTWSRRASKHLDSNVSALLHPDLYRHIDRYGRAVNDIDRVLDQVARAHGVALGLANYQDLRLSPLRSSDLIRASEQPETSPFYGYFMERLMAVFEDEEPSVVGISLNYLSQAIPAFSMIGLIRKLCPDARLVLGGGLVTSWLSNPGWRNPFDGLVDDMVAGPGEGPLLDILGLSPSDRHASPDYSPFHEKSYLSPGFVLPYSASNGCYWSRCTFCPEKAEGGSYSPLPVDKSISDIEDLIERENPCLIHFLDNAMSPALLTAIVDNPPGIPWYGFARVTRRLTDPDFCRNLKRSGCVMMKIGLESGDQSVLDALDKGIDLKEASMALKNLRDAGIGTYIYLLFGTPSETYSEAKNTLDYVIEHQEYISYLNLAIFNMPAYGPDAAGLDTEDFYSGDLTLYRQFRHPGGWDRKHVRQFLDREFRRNPAIQAILRRDPPVFTSNHAPFFVMSTGGQLSGCPDKSGLG
ncbi:MAG: radical SAM protein [Deltaproteobacteria bacterium]|nr:radical SAM protein [Deltaproteobacteria bacterium]MBW2596141.1 radical SAM protein [Deltaproteobacteria bacterium]MBW2649783.1 radical SAM protein [Deltaproteobacteria bacterium]